MSETEPSYNRIRVEFDDDGNPSKFLVDSNPVWASGASGCSCGNEECDRPAPDAINPKHYAVLNPQPWDVIDAWGMDYFSGSVLKYLSRWKNKNGLEDLLKARTFLDKLIAIEEGK